MGCTWSNVARARVTQGAARSATGKIVSGEKKSTTTKKLDPDHDEQPQTRSAQAEEKSGDNTKDYFDNHWGANKEQRVRLVHALNSK